MLLSPVLRVCVFNFVSTILFCFLLIRPSSTGLAPAWLRIWQRKYVFIQRNWNGLHVFSLLNWYLFTFAALLHFQFPLNRQPDRFFLFLCYARRFLWRPMWVQIGWYFTKVQFSRRLLRLRHCQFSFNRPGQMDSIRLLTGNCRPLHDFAYFYPFNNKNTSQ